MTKNTAETAKLEASNDQFVRNVLRLFHAHVRNHSVHIQQSHENTAPATHKHFLFSRQATSFLEPQHNDLMQLLLPVKQERS